MALTDTQQVNKLIKDSKHILIVFNPHDSGDALTSSLALKFFLEKQSKQIDIASDGLIIPKKFHFLEGVQTIKPTLSYLQKFTIKVDVSKIKIETISYDIKDNWLSIYLTPEQGVISKNELRTAQSTFKYDVIITINTPDLETLGNIFHNNTDLFYRTPIINIDHNPTNEYYGQINIVDVTATSSGEILYQLLLQLQENSIDKKTANSLLTGMILATRAFKTPTVTPHTLHIASQLIKCGAERELIIQQLYRTRSLSTLKLWGQALTHLKQDSSLGLVSTIITRQDFIHSGAHPDDLKEIIDDLIINSPEAKIILLLYEFDYGGQTRIHGRLRTDQQFKANELLKPFNPQGDSEQVSFTLENTTLKEAEERIINTIKQGITAFKKIR